MNLRGRDGYLNADKGREVMSGVQMEASKLWCVQLFSTVSIGLQELRTVCTGSTAFHPVRIPLLDPDLLEYLLQCTLEFLLLYLLEHVLALPACPYRAHINFIWACGLGLAHISPIWARDEEPIIRSKLYIGDKWAHGLGLPTSNPSRTEVRSPLTDISNVRL